ncbi:MAG: transglutaminase family protein [Flavobacteriaceae bacterium]|nr:transglutaminase family protein [Flavobacteriaceae bacterium]
MFKYLIFSFLVCFSVFSQEKYSLSKIIPSDYEGAISIVNEEYINVKIINVDKYVKTKKKVVTVLSEKGMQNLDFTELYDKTTKIKQVQVTQLNSQGNLIKVFKQKDFKDYSLSQGMAITDSRFIEFDFKPVEYPVIFIYESEIESKSTAFLPKWYPIQNYDETILESTFTVENNTGINWNQHLYNESFVPIKNEKEGNKSTYVLKNFKTLKKEEYSPNSKNYLPYVLTSLEKVSLEGVRGDFSSWDELGTWYYLNFFQGRDVLHPEVQNKIKNLVVGVDDDIEKARILYEYMQSHTRYISIQLGIGGWKPMLANDVSRLSYGDCKALSNYYSAMLKVVGITSFPVVLYGSATPIDIQEESVCFQGNHMIIAIPLKTGGYQWVECTDNQEPFGYIAGFTDNRRVLVIKEKGTEIVNTKQYIAKENTQESKAHYILKANGDLEGKLNIVSKGIQFGNRSYVNYLNSKDKEKFYKKFINDFSTIQFSEINTSIKSKEIVFEENIAFVVNKYANKLGNRLVFSMNNWNSYYSVLSKNKNRLSPLYIKSSWIDSDEIELEIPEGYEVDFLPSEASISTKFGKYNTTYELAGNKILYKKIQSVNGGTYTVEDYELYKTYREQIAKFEQDKVVLKAR